MIVFKKGKLKRQVSAKGDIVTIKLFHEKTRVGISISFSASDKLNNYYLSEGKELNMTTPYIVTVEDEYGDYNFYEEVWDNEKNLLENYKEAISLFEEKIWDELDYEDEPQPTPPPQMPTIGDIINSNGVFGLVTEITDKGRIKANKITKEQAFEILKERNMSENGGNDTQIIMMKGGKLFKKGGLTDLDLDLIDDNVFIVTYTPKSGGGGGGGQGEPQPPNIQDINPEPKDDTGEEPTDRTDNPVPPNDDGEGKEGKDNDGEGKDGEGKDGKGKDGKDNDGKGKDGKGKDGEGKDGEPKEGGGDDGGFTDDNEDWGGGEGEDDELDLDDLIKDVRQKEKEAEKQAIEDATEILNEFGFKATIESKQRFIKDFRSAQNVKNALGRKELFKTNNKERIENAINKIFE